MSFPRVSAIIPVHNCERYVADSIRSVLEQSHEIAECIVVDDGSTDSTSDVLASFGDAIVVLRQEHRGVAAARNTGMSNARGDYFAFLDADDVWLPDKTAMQVAALASSPHAGAAYTGYVMTDERLRWKRLVLHSGGDLSIRRAAAGNSSGLGFSQTGMVRREVVEAAGPFDERLSSCADFDFWWRLTQVAPVIGVRRPLALYRRHPYGQMHRDLRRAAMEMRVVWDEGGLSARSKRRLNARLEVHLAAELLRRRQFAVGMAHLRVAVGENWMSVALRPVSATSRRIAQVAGAGIYRFGSAVSQHADERPAHVYRDASASPVA